MPSKRIDQEDIALMIPISKRSCVSGPTLPTLLGSPCHAASGKFGSHGYVSEPTLPTLLGRHLRCGFMMDNNDECVPEPCHSASGKFTVMLKSPKVRTPSGRSKRVVSFGSTDVHTFLTEEEQDCIPEGIFQRADGDTESEDDDDRHDGIPQRHSKLKEGRHWACGGRSGINPVLSSSKLWQRRKASAL